MERWTGKELSGQWILWVSKELLSLVPLVAELLQIPDRVFRKQKTELGPPSEDLLLSWWSQKFLAPAPHSFAIWPLCAPQSCCCPLPSEMVARPLSVMLREPWQNGDPGPQGTALTLCPGNCWTPQGGSQSLRRSCSSPGSGPRILSRLDQSCVHQCQCH